MNATVETLDNDKVKLTVTATAAEVDEAVGKAYADIATKVRIPGFRKGKVPRPVIDANVGRETVLAQASEDLVARVFPLAVEETGVLPAEPAEVDELDVVTPGEDFTFDAVITKRPEIAISSADGVTVAVEPIAVPEDRIDSQIEYLRERFAQVETVERGIEPDDFALISFTGYVDGETYDNNEVSEYLYELGRGQMPSEFDEALLGTRAGEDVVAEFPIPATSTVPEFVGKTARFDIKVREVKAKVLPPVDDEFAASVGGFESLEALRADIRARLEAANEERRTQAIELEARKELASRLEAEVPEKLAKERRDDLFAELERNLAGQDLEFDEYCRLMGTTPAEVEEGLREQAIAAVGQDLALEALYRDKDLQVAEGAMDEEFERMAKSYEMSAKEVYDTFLTRGLVPVVRLELIHRTAVAWLLENVTVVDKAPQDEAAAKPAKAAKKKKQDKPEKAVADTDEEAAADAGEQAESTEEDA